MPPRTPAKAPRLQRLAIVRVRLTRKFAEQIDGVDLEGCHVGDVLDLPATEARMLVAEEWAVPEADRAKRPAQRRSDDVDVERAS